MIIILTGLSGSGKTATGKQLANLINGSFLDLDSIIEFNTKQSISSLFYKYSEKNFRKIESFILNKILCNMDENMVLSLGGGAFINEKNKQLCLKKGTVVWLNTSLFIIKNRLKFDLDNRPLLKKETNIFLALSRLLNIRQSHYKQAHYTINIDDKRLKPLAIAKIIKETIAK